MNTIFNNASEAERETIIFQVSRLARSYKFINSNKRKNYFIANKFCCQDQRSLVSSAYQRRGKKKSYKKRLFDVKQVISHKSKSLEESTFVDGKKRTALPHCQMGDDT